MGTGSGKGQGMSKMAAMTTGFAVCGVAAILFGEPLPIEAYLTWRHVLGLSVLVWVGMLSGYIMGCVDGDAAAGKAIAAALTRLRMAGEATQKQEG